MKISVSLPDNDIAFLDAQGPNRSATVHEAIAALRQSQLTDQYQQAYADWVESGDSQLWDGVLTDGVGPA